MRYPFGLPARPSRPPLALTTIDHEPRILDVDLAERLGFARPRAIRQLIHTNVTELEGYGPLATERGKSRGQEFTAHYLNEEQALLLCMFSNTDRAVAVRKEVVQVFTAYRRGQLQRQ